MAEKQVNILNREFQSAYVSLVSILLIIAGIVVPALSLDLGFYPWKDEEYQLLCMDDYRNNPLTGFTMFIGYLWAKYILNDSFLSFRILAYICNTLSVLIPTLYFYYSSRRLLLSAWLFFVLQLGQSLFGLMSYEWDTMSNLLLSVTCVVAWSYYTLRSITKLILLAVFSALSIYSRIPDIAVIIVALALIIVSVRPWKRLIADTIIYISVTLVMSEVMNLIIWGGFDEFLASWTADNVITGHNGVFELVINQILGSYTRIFRDIFLWIGLIGAVWFVNHLPIKEIYKKYGVAFVGFLLLSLFLMMRATTVDGHNYYIELFLVTIALIPLLSAYKSLPLRKPTVYALILLGITLVSMAGSDCGIAKLLCLPLFPLALLELLKFRSKTINVFLLTVSIVAVITYPVLRLKNPYNKDWMNNYVSCFEDIPKLQGIKGNPDDGAKVSAVTNWAREVEKRGDRILFIGPSRYMFDYILDHREDYVDRYPVQRYHDDNKYETIDMDLLDSMIDNFDFIHLSLPLDRIQFEEVKSDFAAKGFTVYEHNDNSTILKRCQHTE